MFNLGSRNDGSFMFINPRSGVTAPVQLTMPPPTERVPLYAYYIHSESISLAALVHPDEQAKCIHTDPRRIMNTIPNLKKASKQRSRARKRSRTAFSSYIYD
ncbi:uncharacterized protein LOC113464181 [Ceratina calcarata]|uniref:Uncharacterized protein LOC113464181 n=1 Tax=Ceratina calcarata TaxID=156304 RepID=A0AAJ7W9Q3_9HYME|nr:uncharacterized protein LOC113464181 [Ceratina calcarata]